MSTTPNTIVERNIANAQLSTGPKTEAGKSAVAQNARKWGMFISDATLEHEDSQDIAQLFADYVLEYCPVTASEEELVRQIAMASHRLRRLDRIENAALFTTETARTRHEASVILQQKYASVPDFLASIERARTHAERAFNRAYNQLEARKHARWFSRTPPTNLEVEQDSRHLPLLQNKPNFYGKQTSKPPAPPVTPPPAAPVDTPLRS